MSESSACVLKHSALTGTDYESSVDASMIFHNSVRIQFGWIEMASDDEVVKISQLVYSKCNVQIIK